MKSKLDSFVSNHIRVLRMAIIFTLTGFLSSLFFLIFLSPLSLFVFSAVGIVFFFVGFLLFAWVMYDEFIKEHSLFRERDYPAQTVVVKEGDTGDEMYFISKGQVEVLKKKNGEDELVGRLKEGDYFGEMALLGDGLRTATVKASTDLKLIAIGKQNFMSMIKNMPQLSAEIGRTVETRQASNSSSE